VRGTLHHIPIPSYIFRVIALCSVYRPQAVAQTASEQCAQDSLKSIPTPTSRSTVSIMWMPILGRGGYVEFSSKESIRSVLYNEWLCSR
jgi:hypothetical protein